MIEHICQARQSDTANAKKQTLLISSLLKGGLAITWKLQALEGH
jgi:hypothetical protein